MSKTLTELYEELRGTLKEIAERQRESQTVSFGAAMNLEPFGLSFEFQEADYAATLDIKFQKLDSSRFEGPINRFTFPWTPTFQQFKQKVANEFNELYSTMTAMMVRDNMENVREEATKRAKDEILQHFRETLDEKVRG